MRCSACGAENRPQARFCTSCGAALAAPAPAIPAGAGGARAAPAIPAGAARAAPAAPAAVPSAARADPSGPDVPTAGNGGAASQVWRLLAREPTGLGQLVVVFALSAALSAVLWLPGTFLAGWFLAITPFTNCAPYGHSPEGTRCALQNGLLGFLPATLLAALIVLLRGVLPRLLRVLTPRLPETGQFLTMPLIATALFTLTWAAARRVRPDQPGLLPQIFFPAVAGTFAFAVMRWGPSLLRLLDLLIAQRDRIRGPVRALIAAAVPLLFAFAIAGRQRPADAARFEHLTVLVGMAAGFLMLAPRIHRRGEAQLPSDELAGDDELDDALPVEALQDDGRRSVGASA